MRIKVSASHTNLYKRSQVILRYLRFLICVTKRCKLWVFKKEKKVEKNFVCFSSASYHMQIVSLPWQHILHTSFFFIITIELFWPVSLCHKHTLSDILGPLTHDFCLLSLQLQLPRWHKLYFFRLLSFLSRWFMLFRFSALTYAMYLFSIIADGLWLFQELVYAICLQ